MDLNFNISQLWVRRRVSAAPLQKFSKTQKIVEIKNTFSNFFRKTQKIDVYFFIKKIKKINWKTQIFTVFLLINLSWSVKFDFTDVHSPWYIRESILYLIIQFENNTNCTIMFILFKNFNLTKSLFCLFFLLQLFFFSVKKIVCSNFSKYI